MYQKECVVFVDVGSQNIRNGVRRRKKKLVRISQLKTRPELYAMMPRPTKEDYRMLKDSIKKNGQQSPIIIDSDNYVVDGYTRLSICNELNITPKIQRKKFKNYDEEVKYVLQANLHRRHLNAFQRVELVYDNYRKRAEMAKNSRARKKDSDIRGNSAKYFAALVGVNQSTMNRITFIKENGTDIIQHNVRTGKTSIESAYRYLKSAQYPNNEKYKKPRNYRPKRCPTCGQSLPKKMVEVTVKNRR